MNTHFDICACPQDLNDFEKDETKFINGFMAEYKDTIPHISKNAVYSLLLVAAITFDRAEMVENILSTEYEDNILTYTNGLYHSPLSIALQRGNDNTLNIIKSYIQRYHNNIVKRTSICNEDCANFLTILRYPQSKNLTGLQFYNEYLLYLYNEEALIRIKELIDTFD